MFMHFLASLGHLFFHIKCEIIQFSKTIEILTGISLNVYNNMGRIDMFVKLSLPLKELDMFYHLLSS